MGQPHERHSRDEYFIEGEGLVGASPARRKAARAAAETPPFRFSRMGPTGTALAQPIRTKVARVMTAGRPVVDGSIPAGYTYLGQFVDHDLTFDQTTVMLGTDITPADLVQGRSPTLDLDALYGAGPADPVSAEFYSDDRHLKMGRVVRVTQRPRNLDGFDLPRVGRGQNRRALIPDARNDENLAVAQTHLAFSRFHNRVVDQTTGVPPAQRFGRARRRVVMHYQWMLKTDFLTRICGKAVVNDVFTNGRKIFEVGADPLSMPTMPVEFSVAAFRLGHSMVRAAYDWNAEFPNGAGTLDLLFFFSGTSGSLGGGSNALPSNWIADWRRLYRFTDIQRGDLKPPRGRPNLAHRIDPRVSPALRDLPPGAFGGTDTDAGTIVANLAFRNLTRATMLKLASGQQMAAFLRGKGVPVTTLTRAQLAGRGEDAMLETLTPTERDRFLQNTPLWFYVLREAELNGGRLTGVGARIVVETFHRAMEASRFSIVREPDFRPSLGPVAGRFTMMDLLIFAFRDNVNLLAPLGD